MLPLKQLRLAIAFLLVRPCQAGFGNSVEGSLSHVLHPETPRSAAPVRLFGIDLLKPPTTTQGQAVASSSGSFKLMGVAVNPHQAQTIASGSKRKRVNEDGEIMGRSHPAPGLPSKRLPVASSPSQVSAHPQRQPPGGAAGSLPLVSIADHRDKLYQLEQAAQRVVGYIHKHHPTPFPPRPLPFIKKAKEEGPVKAEGKTPLQVEQAAAEYLRSKLSRKMGQGAEAEALYQQADQRVQKLQRLGKEDRLHRSAWAAVDRLADFFPRQRAYNAPLNPAFGSHRRTLRWTDEHEREFEDVRASLQAHHPRDMPPSMRPHALDP